MGTSRLVDRIWTADRVLETPVLRSALYVIRSEKDIFSQICEISSLEISEGVLRYLRKIF